MKRCIMTVLFLTAGIPLSAGSLPEIVVQTGHTLTISDIAFTPDGRCAVSASEDRTIKVWSVASGKEMRTLKGHTSYVTSVSVSPDGKQLLSGSGDHSVKLWNLETGELVKNLAIMSSTVRTVCFSPDGSRALYGTDDGLLIMKTISTGEEVRRFSGHTGTVFSVQYAPDGKTVFSAGEDCMLRSWDAESGTAGFAIKGHSKRVYDLAVSGNGKLLLSASSDGTVKLWDARKGKEIRTFSGHGSAVNAVGFSADGRNAVSVSNDDTARVWDIETGRELTVFKGHTSLVYAVAASPVSTLVLSGSADRVIKLWDMKNGSDLQAFKRNAEWVYSISFSPDGKSVLSASADGTMTLWDYPRARAALTFPGHTKPVLSAVFTPDGKRVVSSSEDGTVRVWDAGNGRCLTVIKGFRNSITYAAVSPDGRYAAACGGTSFGGDIAVWDTASGKEIWSAGGSWQCVTRVAFSSDGRTLYSYSGDKTIRAWNMSTGKEVRSFVSDRGWTAAFSADGTEIAVAADTGTVRIHETASGKIAATFQSWVQNMNAMAFAKNGELLVSGAKDGTMRVWNIKSGKETVLTGRHGSSVIAVQFSPDSKLIASCSSDNTSRLWDASAGTCLCSFVSGNGKWLAFSPEGYWDGSRDGGDLVSMVRGMDCWNIDQFAAKNNRPDLILSAFPGADAGLISHFRAQYLRRLKKLGLSEGSLGAEGNVPVSVIDKAAQDGCEMKLTFTLSDGASELSRYQIYVNDVPLFGAEGKAVSGRKKTITEEFSLGAGENKIEVSCMNRSGAESYRAVSFAHSTGSGKGDLYFIGFGVSKYRDSSLDLQYADKDAKELAELFGRMKGEYGNVYAKAFTNEDVTVENIKKSKELLKNAKADDTFVLFIAGHGVHDTDRDSAYYYLTHGADRNDLKGTCADFDLIEDLLQGIAPRRKLFLMDTCESGETEESVSSAYFAAAGSRGIKARTARAIAVNPKRKGEKRPFLLNRERYIYNDLLRRSGAIVFSSSRGGEFSYESDRIKNGYFTRSIMDALSGKAAKKSAGSVYVDELRTYVSEAVPQETGDLQHPTVDRDNLFVKFAFPTVK